MQVTLTFSQLSPGVDLNSLCKEEYARFPVNYFTPKTFLLTATSTPQSQAIATTNYWLERVARIKMRCYDSWQIIVSSNQRYDVQDKLKQPALVQFQTLCFCVGDLQIKFLIK